LTEEQASFDSRLLSSEVRRKLVYHSRALQAAQYVRRNIGRRIRLQDVAGEIGMTPAAFSRFFADKVGITFSRLIMALRIECALDELERNDTSVSDLARRAGYQLGNFCRVFKQIMGRTPSEHRRHANDRCLEPETQST
jgi:AraC-like DNA-binding protein